MFLRNFIKKGLLDAVGKLPDYQVILNATGWYEKGVLLEEDLIELNEAIEKNHENDSNVAKEEFENETEETSEEE